MTLQQATLTIQADADGDGSAETGVFEMAGNLEVTPSIRTGYIIGGRGSTFNAVISNLVADGESKRQGFFLDLGGGARAIEINFRGWKGAIDENGNNLQWGNDSSQTKTQASATGQDPLTQIDVLMRYLTVGEIDSRNPATLEYGEYSSSGLYSSLGVVIEGPTMTRAAEDGSWFDGSMTCIEAADVRNVWDLSDTQSHE